MDDQRGRILDWIDSIKDTTSGRKQFNQGEQDAYSPPSKRCRSRRSCDSGQHTFVNPYNTAIPMPNTPPPSMSEPSSRKRAAVVIDEDDRGIHSAGNTPKAQPPPIFETPMYGKKRSRSNSPTKLNRSLLQMLEKPIFVKNLESNVESLADDIRPLYRRIRDKSHHREEIIPHEVREQVVALLGEDGVREYNFRRDVTKGAEALHAALCDIELDAQTAAEYNYHEAGWNNCVHTPILKLVFPSRPRGRQHPAEGKPASARFVPVMSTAILHAYLPGKHSKLSELRMAATDTRLDSGTGSGSWMSSASSAASSGTGQTYSGRGDSKRVDYALVMDTADSTPLNRFFAAFAHEEALEEDTIPHVNHVMYQPLQWSPIACSIETKVEAAANDPMLQLGTWVASWHKRMRLLRQYLFWKVPSLQPRACEERLASTLLIEVVNHEWRLYFACDQGTSIALHGPLSIGSTKSLIEAYMLVAILEVIRDWIETTFYEIMDRWFLCKEILYG